MQAYVGFRGKPNGSMVPKIAFSWDSGNTNGVYPWLRDGFRGYVALGS